MILYLSIVFVSMIIISVLNIWLGTPVFGYSPWWVIAMVSIAVVFEIAVDGIFAKLVNISPNKWFTHDKKIFKVSKRERNFYEKIKIRFWKDKVLELGALGGFSKKKLADPNNPEYLLTFLMESNKGVVVHIGGMILGFLAMLIFPLKYAFVIGLPVAMVNVLLNLMSTMVLRYNIPKLLVAYERVKRTKALAEKKAAESKKEQEESSRSEPVEEETVNGKTVEVVEESTEKTGSEKTETEEKKD